MTIPETHVCIGEELMPACQEDAWRTPPGSHHGHIDPSTVTNRGAKIAAKMRKLRAALNARDAFIGVVAHELRSPMAPICGQVELLQGIAIQHGASPEIILGMAKLRATIDRYMRRATTLIETTRIASGRRRLYPEPVNLSELVHALVEDHKELAVRARTPLEADITAGITGRWDAVAVEEVVENLLSNALKYAAGAPVKVALSRHAAEARLTVRDHGPGIPPEDQQRIFAPFEQMAVGAARRGGFGIGLWVARELVQAMRGELTLTSAAGQGATFTVALPIGRAQPG